jgi:NADPH:quinone reductase-like Zn-dependent oxidoreductase
MSPVARLPATLVIRRYGGPKVLEYTDVPDPKFSQNSVLVRVRAAELNPADHHAKARLDNYLE